jgi:hypothetical protein
VPSGLAQQRQECLGNRQLPVEIDLELAAQFF